MKKTNEEKILESYEKLLNWGVKKFLPLTDDCVGAEDIKQEGRVVILQLIRNYDNKIGTLKGYINSMFYKKMVNSLKLYKKRTKVVLMDNFDILKKGEIQDFDTLEKIEEIKRVCSNTEFTKLVQYAKGYVGYSEIKKYIDRVRKRLR
jgi:DNA-directed RNA polymerase specialized sigma24 family protein